MGVDGRGSAGSLLGCCGTFVRKVGEAERARVDQPEARPVRQDDADLLVGAGGGEHLQVQAEEAGRRRRPALDLWSNGQTGTRSVGAGDGGEAVR